MESRLSAIDAQNGSLQPVHEGNKKRCGEIQEELIMLKRNFLDVSVRLKRFIDLVDSFDVFAQDFNAVMENNGSLETVMKVCKFKFKKNSHASRNM